VLVLRGVYSEGVQVCARSRQPQALPSMPAHSKLIHGKQWDGPAVLVVFFYVAQQGGALVSRLQQAAP